MMKRYCRENMTCRQSSMVFHRDHKQEAFTTAVTQVPFDVAKVLPVNEDKCCSAVTLINWMKQHKADGRESGRRTVQL